ncbi:MAG: type I-E CRISPR-associated protein Cas7/Cse4/CasC, partial [Synergistaceae bacterium]|nr:type I-E CRISPR-associated protein Cas7/Cse4/CasC [Synergistaceae bacterium]
DFHVIQTVPPSCVNRDDTGRPKTAVYGGVTRARVSSQAWKHAMREMFKDIFTDEKLGFRTKHAVSLIAEKLVESGMDAKKAEKSSAEAIKKAKSKRKDKKAGSQLKDKDNTTGALLFISSKQVKALADAVLSCEKDDEKYAAALNAALKELPSIDIALFGRMVADDAGLNVDAACQVAHSISTHFVESEYDYFTAVDDCSPSDNAGAGHLGTMEFNSSTLYRYATVNVMDLFNSIGSDTQAAVLGFARAFICSMPTGKQNSYANRTLPDMVYVTIRDDQPVNFSGAFERPVSGRDKRTREPIGFVNASNERLFAYAEEIYKNYCGKPRYSFLIGNDEIKTPDVERKNLEELLEALGKIIADEVE